MTSESVDGAEIEVLLNGASCQGYGICLGIAPDAFDIPSGSPVAVLIRSTFPASERAVLEDAVRSCPAQAISIAVRQGPETDG